MVFVPQFLSSSARRVLSLMPASYAMMAASREGSPSAYNHLVEFLVENLGLAQSTNPEGPGAPRVDQDKATSTRQSLASVPVMAACPPHPEMAR